MCDKHTIEIHAQIHVHLEIQITEILSCVGIFNLLFFIVCSTGVLPHVCSGAL